MNGDLHECKTCKGNGFRMENCSCHEAGCPHASMFRAPTAEPVEGMYQKFWIRRTDGTSGEGYKHAKCDYLVLDWIHDPFAIPAALAYADACEKEYPELARDIRERAKR